MGTYIKEVIRCPTCGYVQNAKINTDHIWSVYMHKCGKCGYEITESEWDPIIKEDE